MDREATGAFLRSRRESVVVEPGVSRRRTPGLRRSEVAERAHISLEHYTNLERGRGAGASREVIFRVALALNLTGTETAHLYALAGYFPRASGLIKTEVPDDLTRLIHALPTAAAVVLSARYDVLAWNALAATLFEDFGLCAPHRQNLIRDHFLGSSAPVAARNAMSGAEEFSLNAVVHVRSLVLRYPDDPEVTRLYRDLMRGSGEFDRLWRANEVGVITHARKIVRHPRFGELSLAVDILDRADIDQKVVLYTPDSGSETEAKIVRLIEDSQVRTMPA